MYHIQGKLKFDSFLSQMLHNFNICRKIYIFFKKHFLQFRYHYTRKHKIGKITTTNKLNYVYMLSKLYTFYLKRKL